MKMTNRWNRFIYRLWSPVYDATIGHFFLPGRKQAIELLNLQPVERILLVGVGTAADLPLLPEGVQVVGVDISPDILTRARQKLPLSGREITLIQGDAQQLLFEENGFDSVIFNLILSVIPCPKDCFRGNLRALKPGGRAVVFDKFLANDEKITPGRRLLNAFSTLLGTDITRKFEDINAGSGCETVKEEASLLKGVYRVIMLRKMADS